MIAMLAAAALTVPTGPADAQARQAGNPSVRGRLYENPRVGFAVAWDPVEWTASDPVTAGSGGGAVDMLTLENDTAITTIESWLEDPNGVEPGLDACVGKRLTGLQAEAGLSDVRVVEAPALSGGLPFGGGVKGRWSATVQLSAGGTALASIGIVCGSGPGAGQPSIIRETRILFGGGTGPGWPSMFEGYWYRPVAGAPGPVFDIRASFAPGSRPPGLVVVRVTAENLDVTPGRFDVAALAATERGMVATPLGYSVIEAPGDGIGPVLELGVGERLTVDVVFGASDPMAVGVSIVAGGQQSDIMQPCCGGPGMLPLIRLSD